MPVPGLALRLPSSIARRAPQPQPSVGDDPLSPPDSARTGGVDDVSLGDDPRSAITPSVFRSRFLLEHRDSAQLTDIYEVENQKLGVGGFGTVRLARLRGAPNVVRAVKAVKTHSAAAERSVRSEVSVLKKLDHPHICRLLETFEGIGCMYLVMEYVDGKELFDHIQEAFSSSERPDESLAARIMRQLFGALRYCHGHGVVHRDLKPENVMVQRPKEGAASDEVDIKLIDFGLAVLLKPGRRPHMHGTAGTAAYNAPEVRVGMGGSPPADMWSAGVVMHALLVGILPSEEVRFGEERLDLHAEEYDIVSPPAKQVLAGLIEVDPDRRLSAADAAATIWCTGSMHAPLPKPRFRELMFAFSAFHRGSMLQRAMLTALAVQLASERISDLREQFLAADRDRNGKISREELAMSLRNSASKCDPEVDSWVDSVFDSLDTDGSQELEYTEWLAAALRQSMARSDAALHAAFRVCDVDRNGKISAQEVARILAHTAEAEDETANALLREFDSNGDGELDFEEFRVLIRRSLITCGSVVDLSVGRSPRGDFVSGVGGAAHGHGAHGPGTGSARRSVGARTPSTCGETAGTPSEASLCSYSMSPFKRKGAKGA